MTKRVRAAEALGVRINETELGVMRFIASQPGMAVFSIGDLSRELGCSVATVRNSLRALYSKGLVSVRARYLRNGGQLENEYELTDEGKQLLSNVEQELRRNSWSAAPRAAAN